MAKQINFNGFLLRQFGAYIRTDLSALVQINGVGTGIIGMMGLAERGPLNRATTITSYTELVNTFGDGPLVRHGLAAYIGGANTIVAVRMDTTGTANAAASADLTITEVVAGSDVGRYRFDALEPGTFGNNIAVRVRIPAIENVITADSETEVSELSVYDNVGYVVPSDLADIQDSPIGAYATVSQWDPSVGYSLEKYAIFQWNGFLWGLIPEESVRASITTRLGSVEETIEFPYFMVVRDWMRALVDAGEVPYYYLLRNTVNGQLREIPETWLAANTVQNNLDLETFESIVNSLKADEEELYTGNGSHQFSLAAPTLLPFDVIKGIMDSGGLGSGPSSFVTISSITTNPALMSLGFTNLAGGTNSADGTGWTSMTALDSGLYVSGASSPTIAWDNALEVLENEEVNFVQPAYIFGTQESFTAKYGFFKALAAKIVAHVNLMSNTPNRKFRTAVLGLPSGQDGTVFKPARDFLTLTQDVSGVINNDRMQLWAGGFFSTALENVRAPRLYGAEWLASFAAGAHAAREVSVSLTFAPLAGIFTDGLEYAWSSAQKDDLYGRSLAFVLKRRTSGGATEFVAAHNYTSFTGAPSKGIQLFITRRITDYMNSFLYKNLEENFIGAKSRGAETAARIGEFVTNLLNRLIIEDTLVAVQNVVATVDDTDPTIYNIEFDFQPVTEINFILTTNRLVYNLA